MKFRLYREHGALNSAPIFDAFEQGLNSLGLETTKESTGIPVIWSVLWSGRMLANKKIYHEAVSQGKPIVIIEVGNLVRNKTWRICLNHINGQGYFGNDTDLDMSRPEKLKIKLENLRTDRKPEILIATQHSQSLQWEGMPPMSEWVSNTISEIRRYTDRKIKIRPHPRSPLRLVAHDVEVLLPKQIPGTYDDFDIDYNYHCVINHNSGPAVQAAIKGVPIICDRTSLASALSNTIENIENVSLPDRRNWLVELSHTEWTVDEISKGIPLARLLNKIS